MYPTLVLGAGSASSGACFIASESATAVSTVTALLQNQRPFV